MNIYTFLIFYHVDILWQYAFTMRCLEWRLNPLLEILIGFGGLERISPQMTKVCCPKLPKFAENSDFPGVLEQFDGFGLQPDRGWNRFLSCRFGCVQDFCDVLWILWAFWDWKIMKDLKSLDILMIFWVLLQVFRVFGCIWRAWRMFFRWSHEQSPVTY